MMSAFHEVIDARGVATNTLNRPDRRNAFDDMLISERKDRLRRPDADTGIRAAVPVGSGRGFSTGVDLDWMRRTVRYGKETSFVDGSAPGAPMQGVAYGGGIGLAAFLDKQPSCRRGVG